MQVFTAIVLSVSAAAASYKVDFEGEGETKSAYASGTVNLGGIDWDLTEVLIGTLAEDWKEGARSARLRGYGSSAMTMLGDKPDGLDTIRFQYRRYGTDEQVDWQVEYSSDSGFNWYRVGDSFIAPADDTVSVFSNAVQVTGPVRVRIKRATESGTANRRLNIDNIWLGDFSLPEDVPSVGTFAVTNMAPTVARAGGIVIDEKGAVVTERGVAYCAAGLPGTNGTVAVASGGGPGGFTVNLSGLMPGENYYARAYAVNARGVGYGTVESFTAACFTNAPTALAATRPALGVGFTARWSSVAGAGSYKLQVSRDSDFRHPGVAALFRETMGRVDSEMAIETHAAAGGFDNHSLVMGDGGAQNPADIRSTNASSGYEDGGGNAASGGANVFFSSTAGERGFCIAGIPTKGYTDLRLGFGYRKAFTNANATFSVAWSADEGAVWTPVPVSGLPLQQAGAGWYFIDNLELPRDAEGQGALALRWVKTGATKMRIDDVLLVGDGGEGSLLPGYAGLAVEGLETTVSGLSPGVYYYRVRAIGGGACRSAFSNVVSVRIRPAPTSLRVR